jgi:[acyl-carrier-protein] S-malonyltransferase
MSDSGIGLLFPGQGSQFVGMGRDLVERFPAARDAFEEADDVLGFSLSCLCWEGPEEELLRTRNAQPAILVHSIAVWRLVQERLDQAAVAAGHSLGEFSAYVAAGALDFRAAVRLVRTRGELMFHAGQQRPGSMAAVIGLDDDAVERVCAEASGGGEAVVAANYNSPGQVVISGDAAAVQRATGLARAAGARRVLPLNVSGAFHSPLMQPAEQGLEDELRSVEFGEPRFAVVSNVTANPVRQPEEARKLLVRQLTAPVRWTASVHAMTDGGTQRFFEVGPGHVLSNLARRIQVGTETTALGTGAQVESFLGSEAPAWS